MAYKSKLTLSSDIVLDLLHDAFGLVLERTGIRDGFFSTVLFLEGGGRRFVLKCFDIDETDIDRIAYAARLNRFLESRGVPVAQWIAPNTGGETLTIGKHLFQLWQMVEGTPYQPGDSQQLREAGSTMGRFHLATESWRDDKERQRTCYWDREARRMTDTWVKVLAGGGPLDQVEMLREHLDRLDKTREAVESLPDCIVHGDFRAQNMIYRGRQVVAILDLDGACRAPRIYDIAYASIFFKAVVDPHPPSAEEIRQFVDAYQAVATLNDQERQCLPGAIGFSILKGLSLWMDLVYVSRSNRDMAATWIDAYLPLLSLMEGNGELVF